MSLVEVVAVAVVVCWKVCCSTSATTTGAATEDDLVDIMLIVVMNRIGWFWKPNWMDDDGERTASAVFGRVVAIPGAADGYASTHASTGTAGGVVPREV